jgi:flagellar biosynthesis anti-sigma factor FlgM
MKIQNDKNALLLESLTKSVQSKPSKETGVKENGITTIFDRVELTSRKDEINRLKEKVKAEPVVRQEKVASIKEALTTETYNVKGELVARSILKSQLLDEIL